MHALLLLLTAAIPPDAPPVIPADAPPVELLSIAYESNDSGSPSSCGCGVGDACKCHPCVRDDNCTCDPCGCSDCPHHFADDGNMVAPPLVITVADRGCPPCERFKSEALPQLDAAGWTEGVHYRLRVVPFGAETVPTFAYHGSEFARGYSGWPEWRRSLVRAMGGDSQGAGRKPVSSSGVQDARLRSAPGYHSHRCNSCGTVWSHDGSGDHYREHSCPNCGRYQNVVYQGAQRGAYRPPAVVRRAYYGGCVGCR